MLEIQPDYSMKEIYRTKAYSSHWATPILVDGFLYGFSNNKLVCMNWETGERVWRNVPKVGSAAFQSLEDDSHEVRIMAAWTLINAGEKKAGFQCLENLLNENSYATLTALNVVDWLGEPGKELMPAVKAFTPEKKSYEERMRTNLINKMG